MKNFFDQAVKNSIQARIDKLSPESKALWGKMNVNQAMLHMQMALEVPIGKIDPSPSDVPKVPKWLLRFFLLKVKAPKGKANTFKELNMVDNKIDPVDFSKGQQNLKAAIEELFKADQLIPENKLAGKFSKTDWGKLTFNHMDHHLRQFGV
ncbi:MAG: hypothetical protein H6582_12335 [Crocinitomicaceae bacterium]|nr:hypothetical protein [Crocinitomicaceae bacterium]